ncbi:Uncharacterized protein SVXHr_0566 [Halorhabdus sp. SVX81]|nr:Uncharacterized protein SVXHr_0566 [Halorhabdus sp. SVX81]
MTATCAVRPGGQADPHWPIRVVEPVLSHEHIKGHYIMAWYQLTRPHNGVVMYLNIEQALEDVSYPAKCADVVEHCGDHVLALQTGKETVGEAIDRCEAGTLRSQREARQTVLSSVSEGAIGRKYYSDRDPPLPDAEWYEPVSL